MKFKLAENAVVTYVKADRQWTVTANGSFTTLSENGFQDVFKPDDQEALQKIQEVRGGMLVSLSADWARKDDLAQMFPKAYFIGDQLYLTISSMEDLKEIIERHGSIEFIHYNGEDPIGLRV